MISMPKGRTGRLWIWRATVVSHRPPRWSTCSARPPLAPPRTSPCDGASSSTYLSTRKESRSALRGFIVGSFVSDELLEGIFKGSFDPAVDFEVYDGTNPTSSPLLY